MTTVVFSLAAEKFLSGAIDLTTHDIKISLLDISDGQSSGCVSTLRGA